MITQMTEGVSKYMDTFTAVKTFVYGAFVFLDIDMDIVQILAILMCIDTVLGVIKTITLGNKFSFKKLLFGLLSKAAVLIVPMVLALTAKALSFDFSWFVNAVLNILVVAEAFSSITNVISIKEKKEMENQDFITILLKKVRNGLKNIMINLGNTIDPEGKDDDDMKG